MNLKSLRRSLREPWVWCGYFLLSRTLGLLPCAWLNPLARLCGSLLAAWRPIHSLILANLEVAFPDLTPDDRQKLCRATCRNLCLTLFEFFWYHRHPADLKAAVDLDTPEGRELVEGTRHGGAALCLSPHLGNWELAGQVFAAHGIILHAVAARIKSRFLEQMITTARTYHGMKLIPERGAVRGMVQVIKAGECIALLMDQNTKPNHGGIFVPFFGLPAAVSRAPASLARRFNVPVYCGAVVRENGRLRLRTAKLPRPVSSYADDAELTAAFMALNEALIQRYPDQYLWYYRRWNCIPADLPPEACLRYPAYAEPVPYTVQPEPADADRAVRSD